MDNEAISFGRFRLDLDRRELVRDDQPVRLGRRPLEILCELASARGGIISKDELMARLWSGRIVEEGNLHVHVSALRKALGDHVEGHSHVVTVPGRGYRLVGLNGPPSGGSNEPRPGHALPLPDKPSIAVLPFQNLSGDPGQEYFADGMVDEIITALARIRWLFVIARNSSFTYKGQAVDVKQVGRELGVRYVLEGSLRKAANRVRITAQLIEIGTGAHLWADRFEGSLADVFELQDHVAIRVAGTIGPTLLAAEIRRSLDRPTTDPDAYDLYLRALHHTFRWEKTGYSQALALLAGAIERDPDYGPALSLAAFCHMATHLAGWADDPETSRRDGIEFARRALRCANNDAGTLGRVAHVLGYFSDDIDPALALVDRALELDPGSAQAWRRSGFLRLWAGQPDLAIEHFEMSQRLDPRDLMSGAVMGIGLGHFYARRFDKARTMLLRDLQERPGWVPSLRLLAACYAHMGQLEKARSTIDRLRTHTPVLIPKAIHFRISEHRELYLSGLRLAAGDTDVSGTIRVTTTGGVAERLRKASLIDAFEARHPDFRLELVISDRILDLSAGEADLAIRSGEPRDKRLIQRKIADVPWAIYASRSYIAHHGAPRCVADIDHHVIVTCSCANQNDPVGQWLRSVAPLAAVVARCETEGEQLRAVKSGAGIAPLLTLHEDADLIRVVDVTDLTTPYYLLMHETVWSRPPVRAFADFVAAEIMAFEAAISGVAVNGI